MRCALSYVYFDEYVSPSARGGSASRPARPRRLTAGAASEDGAIFVIMIVTAAYIVNRLSGLSAAHATLDSRYSFFSDKPRSCPACTTQSTVSTVWRGMAWELVDSRTDGQKLFISMFYDLAGHLDLQMRAFRSWVYSSLSPREPCRRLAYAIALILAHPRRRSMLRCVSVSHSGVLKSR